MNRITFIGCSKMLIEGYIKNFCSLNVVRLSRLQCLESYNNKSNESRINYPVQLHKNKISLTNNVRFFSWDFSVYRFKQFIRRILLIDNHRLQIIGFKWYSTLDKVNYNEFITLTKLPDTFNSWFRITALHVWMLLVRLMADGDESRKIRTAIVEAMWLDSQKRANQLNIRTRHVKHGFRVLSKEFRSILFAYDEGFLENDQKLTDALWYYFLDKQCDDPEIYEGLVSYIRSQIAALYTINTSNIKHVPENIWIPLSPHFTVKK